MTTKRGRKSTEDRMTVVKISDARIQPPAHLDEDELEEWAAIVDSLPADYFRPGDVSLLATYCTASALYKRAKSEMKSGGITLTDDRGKTYANPAHTVLTSQASAMAQMAVKLRLCPSARYSDRKAGAVEVKTSDRPWEDTGS